MINYDKNFTSTYVNVLRPTLTMTKSWAIHMIKLWKAKFVIFVTEQDRNTHTSYTNNFKLTESLRVLPPCMPRVA